jgi:hypothetical protein
MYDADLHVHPEMFALQLFSHRFHSLKVDMRATKSLGLLILSALLLSACTLNSADRMVDWKHGAKLGWIVSTYVPGSDAADLPKCLADLPSADRATSHFVKVSYRHVRQMRYEVAELPPELQAKNDDRIELWPADCSLGKISRISRVFSSTAQ